MVAFEVELLFGVLGAGARGVGEGLEGVQWAAGGGVCRVVLRGGVGADVVVFGAGVGSARRARPISVLAWWRAWSAAVSAAPGPSRRW